jgi:hypothetical protein
MATTAKWNIHSAGQCCLIDLVHNLVESLVLPLKSTDNSMIGLEHDRSPFVLHWIPELEENATIIKIDFLTQDVGRRCVAASSRIPKIETCY